MSSRTTDPALEQLSINAIRVLSMDAVQKADSGHPGTPMALAPVGYEIFTRAMSHNPGDPHWLNRDRFVLSCGHASMLLYSLLHLTGYDLPLDELKAFRQWGSKTPGHPEHGHTVGVETTTGPLGQGIANAIGFAVAEAHLAAVFNREGHAIIDHHTFFICSDGDLMEGVSHEAASFAGHQRLGKLIGFYDDNKITIEGSTALAFGDDSGRRFEAYGWHVQHVDDGNDLNAIEAAIEAARSDPRPSLVVMRTHIGYGSPNRQDSAKAHGEALGDEEVKLTKQNLKYPSLEPFFVPEEVRAFFLKTRERGAAAQAAWQKRYDAYKIAYPDVARELERRLAGKLPEGWESALPTFTAADGNVASRAASGKVLNAIATKVPELIGGSADLAPSTLTLLKDKGDFEPDHYDAHNFHFGIREHGMGSIMNGMALHGGLIPYGATFLIFSDYMRPAVRLAALMQIHVVYVYTHDSIGLGEDGPTHQPIEQLSTLRCIPGLTLIRPGDAGETVEAWRVAMTHTHGPVALVFTRQKLPFIDRSKHGAASGVARGAYVLADATGGAPRVVLMASGSEVQLILEARTKLEAGGIPTRAVSMPSHELFAQQDEAYRNEVLPLGVKRVSIEAAHPMSWQRWVGSDGVAIGIDHYGASSPYQRIYTEFGLTADRVVEAARKLVVD